jgi:membrane-associated phospholipid phosphatase
MPGKVLMAAWTLVSLLGAGRVAASPQASEEQPKASETEKTGEVQQPQKHAETTSKEGATESSTSVRGAKDLGARFLGDQKQIWTSPARLRWEDLNWLVPLSGISAGLFVTDAAMSQHISHNPSTLSRYDKASNVGLGALLGGAGGLWLLSYHNHDEHWRETAFLAGEAALNSLVVVEAMKYPLGRERPYQGDGSGQFFRGGVSFPSEHAAAAWAAAGIVAHEYPGTLTKIVVYSLASLVDYSRYRARQHFPSDVFVGSIIGNMVAQSIYEQHHDLELSGSTWAPLRSYLLQGGETSTANMGSPYVPLDSWVYPAMERLAAMGYIRTAVLGMRPWTRLECVRLLNEAGDLIERAADPSQEAVQLYELLAHEFSADMELGSTRDNRSAQVESVYARMTGISGPPLNDNYHFGQTILNDFGRPYAEGFNSIEGVSAWASSGPLTLYVRGEYQHAPSSPALPLSARVAISNTDSLPVPPATGSPAVNQFELLEVYLGMNIQNWQLSYGKQSLWWGPGDDGAMLFTDNAQSALMFRVNRVSPLEIPGVSRILGPMRLEFFLGQLSGQQFIHNNNSGLIGQWGVPLNPQPFVDGAKLSMRPLSVCEFGLEYTTVFGGPGQPLTTHTYLRSMFSTGNSLNAAEDPGDRRSGIDFSCNLPTFTSRPWLTIYGDSFVEDETSPLNHFEKSAFEGGIYIPRLPIIPKLDLRVEGGSTSPGEFSTCNGCFYFNSRYRASYTNDGNLMGTWIGRAAQGEQATVTYWFSARNTLQLNFRHRKNDAEFLPGGGTQNDAGAQVNVWLTRTTELSGSVQYEKWNIPVLSLTPQSNVTTMLGLTFWPRSWGLPSR